MKEIRIDINDVNFQIKRGNEAKKFLLFVLPYFVGKVDALGAKTRSYLAFPYGPLTLATYVNKNSKTGSKVIIEDLNILSSIDCIGDYVLDKIKIIDPDFIGFNFMFDNSFSYLEDLSKLVKLNHQSLLQVVGGAAATTAANEILNAIDSIDAICYSEGEVAIKNLVDALNPHKVLLSEPWITRKTGNKKINPVYVDSLDDVIDLDYSYVDVKSYSMRESFSPFAVYRYEENVKQFFLVTSRGCPFKCTFCAEPSLHGANMRYASVDKIIDHVAGLHQKYGLNVLTLYDDQLLIDVPRAKDLFRRLAQFNLRIEMPNGVTAVFIDEELALLMKKAGVDTITLAIESGSDYVLRNIINKPLRLPKLKEVMLSLRKAEIFVQGFFVIGMPGELDVHRQETLDLIRDIDLDWASFSVAAPVRGSKLYEDAKINGWLPKEYSVGKFISNSAVMKIPGINNQKIMDAAMEFNIVSNFIESRAMRIGDWETARRLFMEVTERAEKHAVAHFFLSIVEDKLGLVSESQKNIKIANKIVDKDGKWKNIFDKYNLTFNEKLSEYSK
jgi:anaerobic magnesium-protoporphyrin IX monomethyl ester cyclase